MNNLQSQILGYLSRGGRLTVRKTTYLFHTTELRKVVSCLRRRGHVIRNVRKSGTTIDGRSTWYNEYYMPDVEPSMWFKIKELSIYSF